LRYNKQVNFTSGGIMKKLIFGLLIVMLVFVAVGCSSSDEAVYEGDTGWQDNYVTMTTTQTAIYPVPATMSPDKYSGGYTEAITTTTDRMVIRNAYLTLVVDNITSVMSQITTLATNLGGYVVNSNVGENQDQLYASISFRVLAENFEATITALHNLAVDVKSESTTGQDVTQEYTDLNSRLRNLEASEAQLLALMSRAGTVEEILAVQQQLTNTREQIELIKGQMQYLEQSSNLALFSVSLEQSKLVVQFTADQRKIKSGASVQFTPTVTGGINPYTYEWTFGDGETSTEAEPVHVYRSEGNFTVSLKVTDDKGSSAEYTREDYISVSAGWTAGSIVDSAWNGLVSFGHGLAAFFIGLGIFSPVWIAILVILYFAWWRRRKKPKKA
jgi:PKD repeat protein